MPKTVILNKKTMMGRLKRTRNPTPTRPTMLRKTPTMTTTMTTTGPR